MIRTTVNETDEISNASLHLRLSHVDSISGKGCKGSDIPSSINGGGGGGGGGWRAWEHNKVHVLAIETWYRVCSYVPFTVW